MYSQKDLDELNLLMKRFYRNMALYLIAPVLAVAAALIWRIAPLGYIAAAAIAIIVAIGWFGVGSEVNKYRTLVRDILTSPEREVDGVVHEIEKQTIHRDGNRFVPIQVEVDEVNRQSTYTRSVFFDTLKGEFPAKVGDTVHVVLFGNVVKQVEILEAADAE